MDYEKYTAEDVQKAIDILNSVAKALSAAISEVERSVVDMMNKIEPKLFMREVIKYRRRVSYHKRLSERNRLHPKRKARR